MSSLLASLISRHLRLTASKWFNVCHNQNYDCMSITRFFSVLKYDDGDKRPDRNYEESEQQQQQSRFEGNNITKSNDWGLPSNYSRNQQVSINTNHHYPASIPHPKSTLLTGGFQITVGLRHFSTTTVLEQFYRGNQAFKRRDKTKDKLAIKYNKNPNDRPRHCILRYMQDRRLLMAIKVNRNYNTALYINRLPRF